MEASSSVQIRRSSRSSAGRVRLAPAEPEVPQAPNRRRSGRTKTNATNSDTTKSKSAFQLPSITTQVEVVKPCGLAPELPNELKRGRKRGTAELEEGREEEHERSTRIAVTIDTVTATTTKLTAVLQRELTHTNISSSSPSHILFPEAMQQDARVSLFSGFVPLYSASASFHDGSNAVNQIKVTSFSTSASHFVLPAHAEAIPTSSQVDAPSRKPPTSSSWKPLPKTEDVRAPTHTVGQKSGTRFRAAPSSVVHLQCDEKVDTDDDVIMPTQSQQSHPQPQLQPQQLSSRSARAYRTNTVSHTHPASAFATHGHASASGSSGKTSSAKGSKSKLSQVSSADELASVAGAQRETTVVGDKAGSLLLPPVAPPHESKNMALYASHEYRSSIYMSLRRAEAPITPRNRAVLIDWLIEVHNCFHWQPQTLHLLVTIINRFLCRRSVPRELLQLVGVAALLIAGKHEELEIPEIDEFVFVCADAYAYTEITRMEMEILGVLGYRLCAPTGWEFLMIYCDFADVTALTRFTSEFVLELTLQEENFRRASGSLVAAAAFDLACRACGGLGWTDLMASTFYLTKSQVLHCAYILNCIILQNTFDLHACRVKYQKEEFLFVGDMELLNYYPVPVAAAASIA